MIVPKRHWILAGLLAAGCAAAAPEPVLPRVRDAIDKPTVILVPGVSGVRLREAASGLIVWGDARSFFLPHDNGYNFALPIGRGANPALEPAGAIREIRILQYRKEVYGTVFRLMESNRIPFIAHNYDWRLDNPTSARALVREIARHKRIVLICQSNAAALCRYAYKYGDVSLDEAERGLRRVPKGIEKVILVGSSNGGAIRILKELDRGRRYIPIVGRYVRAETLFTFRSLFFDLPSYGDSWVIDEEGRDAGVDLYDAANWTRYGWSIFDEEASRRAPESIFGTVEERVAYLREQLDAARRMQRLLRQVVDAPLPRIYSIQSLDFPTPDRALLAGGDLYFTPEDEVDEDRYVHSRATAPGDYHATMASQNWLGDDEKRAMAHPPVYIEQRHFEMITDAGAQRWILEFLAD